MHNEVSMDRNLSGKERNAKLRVLKDADFWF